jgi:hypothetical protein
VRCVVCGAATSELCNPSTHNAHNRQWDNLTGPQPGPAACCDSCRIVAGAVARLAYAIGYPETGDEITDLVAEDVNTEVVNQ